MMKNVQAEFVRLTAAIAFGVLAAVTAMSIGPAAAQTTRDACADDAFRLCSEAIPDVAKTKACLARHRASLSPRCRSAFSHRRHRH